MSQNDGSITFLFAHCADETLIIVYYSVVIGNVEQNSKKHSENL